MSMTNVTCVNYVRYPLPGTYPHFVGNYIFPIVFVVGVLGNVLNLIVLNKMHIKCKCFLSSMALADLCFFFTMFVLNLSVYDCFALSSAFLKLYYNAKVTLVVLANWFSSASIWYVCNTIWILRLWYVIHNWISRFWHDCFSVSEWYWMIPYPETIISVLRSRY